MSETFWIAIATALITATIAAAPAIIIGLYNARKIAEVRDQAVIVDQKVDAVKVQTDGMLKTITEQSFVAGGTEQREKDRETTRLVEKIADQVAMQQSVVVPIEKAVERSNGDLAEAVAEKVVEKITTPVDKVAEVVAEKLGEKLGEKLPEDA